MFMAFQIHMINTKLQNLSCKLNRSFINIKINPINSDKMQQTQNKSSLNQAQQQIWYFAFGPQSKSSLLHQYGRQHNIPYYENAQANTLGDVLRESLNSSCILSTDVENVRICQQRRSNNYVIFVGQEFSEQQNLIKKQFQQIGRCKLFKSLTDYEGFRKQMYPNLIFFYGPHKQSKQGAAATIAFQTGYTYVQNFPENANALISSIKKTGNYTFSSVFTNPKQIQILVSRFNIRIVHFRFNRTDIPNNDEYFDTEYQLLNYLNSKAYFLSVDAHKSSQVMMDLIGQFLCPKLTFINANHPSQKEYADAYAKDRNIQIYSIFEIQSISKNKNIPLAVTLQDKVKRIVSIIYNDLNAEQVVLCDFPWHVNEFITFQNITRKFNRFVDLDDPKQYMFSSVYSSNIHCLQTQRRIQPNLQFPLINQIQKGQRYWIVYGPQGIGKTTIAKYLQNQYQLLYIQYEPYVTALKEKLLTPEDGQQLPFRKVIAHFKDLLSKNPDQQYLIEGLPLQDNDLKQWIKVIGSPTVINLKAEQNQIIKRQRRKAQSDIAAQISEEQSQKIKELIEKQNAWIQNLNQTSSDATIYTVDFNQGLILAQKLLQSIFQPRVFLVQSNPTVVFHNAAIRYDCCLINLNLNSLAQAKMMVKKSGKRYVILTNYKQTNDKLVSQDLYWIQKNIGKIRYLAIWGGELKQSVQQKLELQRPAQQKKIKNVVQGQENTQEPPAEQPVEQEGQVKKKKLDIFAFQWSKPVCHKNLSQWYFKLKKNIQQHHTQAKRVYQQFGSRIESINNNPSLSIYEVLKPKQ